MNVIDLEHRLIGCFGIVGGSIAAATGAALALKRRGGVAVAFFGDGATNQGYFHECLNFAKVLRRCPVVFVCENNLYGEFTPLEDVTAGEIAEPRRGARHADATPSTATTSGRCGRRGRSRRRAPATGGGPQFIEALTYRFVGHSRSDPGKYRKPGELDAWRERDPLLVARARLAERSGTSEEALDGVDSQVERDHGSRRRGREGRAVPGERRTSSAPVRTRSSRRGPRASEMDFRTASARRSTRSSRATTRSSSSARTSPCAGGVFATTGGLSRSTAPTASSTPRSPSSPWPARPSAAPSAACARSSRSCSATS